MTPSLPLFDRNTCNLPKSQSSFIEWFLIDMCEAWHGEEDQDLHLKIIFKIILIISEFCGIEELIANLHDNHNYWKQLEALGIKNLDDLDDKIAIEDAKDDVENALTLESIVENHLNE